MKVDVDIDACKHGEHEALGNLYKAYADKLLKVCRHYVKDESAAEDILHDAFIIIFTSIGSLKDNSKLEGWMTTIIKNLSLKHLQNTGKEYMPLADMGSDISEEEDEAAENHIALELLLSAIEALPKGNREIFKLAVLDGLSHKEIGEMLGIHPHSSSSQLFRAKKMLRAILIRHKALLLLSVLIPLYIYFMSREKVIEGSDHKPTALNLHKKRQKRLRQKESSREKTDQPESTALPGSNRQSNLILSEKVVSVEEQPLQSNERQTDNERQTMTLHTEDLSQYTVTDITGTNDAFSVIPHISEDKLMALNTSANRNSDNKKKYPWTFNFGYSTHGSANEALSHLNYLSVIDYANGGAAAKLYTWADLENYYADNNALMDSVERVKLSMLLRNRPTDDNTPLGEVAHHHRPKTFGLSVNKQLSPRWIFGTGLTYTKLKSTFESNYNQAKLLKVQKIDYIGIPLRLTYRIWSKGKFNLYTTGGVTFELPVRSSLNTKYSITADSSYTLRSNIHPRYQWSVNMGIGMQYTLFKPFSLYLEPNMFYYFNNGSGIETYRTAHPFFITVPFGLRLTW